ncbi:MAG TPA: M23 family metallopeptidase, partial [Firmicutes bacterium]|nr:M23 family metallopeptidase [Bacillota bacterium]
EIGYPVLNPTVISEYGMREDAEGRMEMNYGIDLAVEAGSPVRAVLAGRVTRLEDYDGSGMAVMLDHGNGLSTYYARLEEVNLKENDTVKAGDYIGKVFSGDAEGNTSFLHFEVWVDGRPVNPREALTGN